MITIDKLHNKVRELERINAILSTKIDTLMDENKILKKDNMYLETYSEFLKKTVLQYNLLDHNNVSEIR